MNTADYLLETGIDNHIALLSNKSEYRYSDLKSASIKLSEALLALGVKPQDRVGLLGANSLFWTAAYLAILKLGAIAIPFSVTTTPDQLQKKQKFVRCEVFCLEKRYYRRLQEGLPRNTPLIFEDKLNEPAANTWDTLPTIEDETCDAVYLFTSGTTARPRVVRLTHRNIQANTDSIVDYLALTANDRIMAFLPFHYCFGTSLLHTHLRVGGSVVTSRLLYPETVLDQLAETACTGIAGVPSVYQTLLRNTTFPQRELKSLKKIQQAGGKLQKVLIQELIDAAPDADVYIMYGQTEATARLSYLPPSLLDTKLGSVGTGIPGVKLEVRNDAGDIVKPGVGDIGEIIAWGDNISPGYLDNPEANAKKFVDGALHTSDLATIDEDGYIYIVDRKGDFIKSYGHRVSSQEIESNILEIQEVVSAAAIGVPDLIKGEAIHVFVTLRTDSSLSPQDVIAHCKQKFVQHLVPSEVTILKSLPINSNGKIVKSTLKQQLESPAS